jgi:hypothetical protein
VSRRPLVFVIGLTVCDSLLWNWSLNGNHDVIALATGLTLPPLALASLWLLAVSAARLLASGARRRTAPRQPARTAAAARARGHGAPTPTAPAGEQPAPAASATSTPSRKIAA